MVAFLSKRQNTSPKQNFNSPIFWSHRNIRGGSPCKSIFNWLVLSVCVLFFSSCAIEPNEKIEHFPECSSCAVNRTDESDGPDALESKMFLCGFCDSVACGDLAEMISEKNGSAAGDENWYRKARQCAKRECDSGKIDACLLLYQYYRDGIGGESSTSQAILYRKRTMMFAYDDCRFRNCARCELLGALLEDLHELYYANQYFAKACACNMEMAFSCKKLDALLDDDFQFSMLFGE